MAADTETLKIDTLSHGIFGVARTTSGIVLVPQTAPGDHVEARIVATRRGYREAELVSVLEPSAVRRTPPCRHLPECGGCPWQQVAYPAQLEAKERALRDALVRIGGLAPESLDLRRIIASPEWGYRHRIDLRVEGEHRLGFYRHRSHRLVEIEECLIADATVNRHLPVAREWLRGVSTTVRRLEIASTGEDAVVFVGNAEGAFRHDGEYHERFCRRHSSVRGIVLFGKGWRRTFGDPRVTTDLPGGLRLETSGGFTQVNPAGNLRLVETAVTFADPGSRDRVLDLFCGAGNLTLPLARRAGSVLGVEVDRFSLDDARRNADRAGIANCRFLQQDAAGGARALAASGERFDVIVLDPPRSGAAAVVEHLPGLAPRRIVYVSCDPATLARDLRALVANGFRPGPIQPIDLFPQTWHLETVTVLRRES